MSKSDTFCPLPWQHLATHPHGGVTLCCISDHTDGLNRARNYKEEYNEFFDLNKQTIEEHMNSDYYKEVRLDMLNNKMPKACMRCYDEEDKGIKPKREHERTVFPKPLIGRVGLLGKMGVFHGSRVLLSCVLAMYVTSAVVLAILQVVASGWKTIKTLFRKQTSLTKGT